MTSGTEAEVINFCPEYLDCAGDLTKAVLVGCEDMHVTEVWYCNGHFTRPPAAPPADFMLCPWPLCDNPVLLVEVIDLDDLMGICPSSFRNMPR